MATFNMKKIKNPIQETVTIQPEDLEAIVFKLAAFNTTIAFKVNAWNLSEDRADMNEMQFSIGATRIVGWEGILDEHGRPIAYTTGNLALLCNSPDFIPYVMEIGSLTIKEGNEMSEKKSEKTEETPEPSENSTETS